MKRICFTVTNDLHYDQRMHRICGSLSRNGYEVLLIGRKKKNSPPLLKAAFQQYRLHCWFEKGKAFYAEYNLRLFFFLLFRKMDAVCAIDLDSILPCLIVSKLKKIRRVYDAHELFTELREVISRKMIHRLWLKVEKTAVPRFPAGYTVSEGIAAEFNRRYGCQYETIRNLPVWRPLPDCKPDAPPFILYQGAVNEARGFEQLIPAMHDVNARLVICGDGNFMPRLKELIRREKLEDRVELRGMLSPDALWETALQAKIAVAVPDREGLNQYLALPNKFFDYLHAGLPQVTVDYPEYRKLNAEWEVAVLIGNNKPAEIAAALNLLLHDNVLYDRLRRNCLRAREVLNWQEEEKKLIRFYSNLFQH